MNHKIHCPKCGVKAKLKMHRRNGNGVYDHTLFFCAGSKLVKSVRVIDGQEKIFWDPIHSPMTFIRQLKGIVL